jgi:hypothetical protein
MTRAGRPYGVLALLCLWFSRLGVVAKICYSLLHHGLLVEGTPTRTRRAV